MPPYAVVEIEDPDDPTACWAAAERARRLVAERLGEAELLVDYTGGTKTMSAMLAAAGLEWGASLSVVRVARRGAVDIVPGTEAVWRPPVASLRARRWLEQALGFVNRYDYAAAQDVLGRIRHEGVPAGEAVVRWTEALDTACRALEAWDRFDHETAYALLRGASEPDGLRARWLPFLDLLVRWRRWRPQEERGARWVQADLLAPVHDLVLNAARRIAQQRFDDAVARLYRALELLGQLRLVAAHGVSAADADRTAVEAWLRGHPERAGERPLRLALRDVYEVLEALGDPLGSLFRARQPEAGSWLERRNQSILAHGQTPVGPRDAEGMLRWVAAFLRDAAEAGGYRLDEYPRGFPRFVLSGADAGALAVEEQAAAWA